MNRVALYLHLVAVLMTAAPVVSAQGPPWEVQPAPEWTALFDRDTGWTGADGIFSIPLDGDERGGNAAGRTLFVFSDTFVGDVDMSGRRLDPTVLINNTGAVLSGTLADPAAMEFYYRTDPQGAPAPLVTPDTPAAGPDHWYWLGDGVAIDGTVHVFGLRMKRPPEGGFATDGVTIISFPATGRPGVPRQVDTPLFLPDDGTRGDIIFGAGILNNTAAAGAPNADGYIYVYGTRNDPLIKKLVAARVRPADFLDFTRWEYYTDTGWGGDITRLAPLTTRVSNELSVSPLDDGTGRYLLVYQEDAIGRYLGLRIGDSPIGPWTPSRKIYECPEPRQDPDVFTYNAKAHPHLSAPGELLISYNVNTLDFWDHFRNADIYRPRFVRLTWAATADASPRATETLVVRRVAAAQGAMISFDIPESGPVQVDVFDLRGRRVRRLLDESLTGGTHTCGWEGRDERGRPAARGVYLIRITTPTGCGTARVFLSP